MFPIKDTVLVDEFQKWMGNYFHISASGEISYFLGIRILRERGSEGKLSIHQEKSKALLALSWDGFQIDKIR